MNPPQNTWSFALVLDGIDGPSDEIEDALYEAGCDDALLAFSGRIATLDFDRTAQTFGQAVLSAIADVTKANVGLDVLRVEPDDFVNASDIARRMNVSREAARKWIDSQRGGTRFPAPVARVGQSPVWSWCQVTKWLYQANGLNELDVAIARFTAALNNLVQADRMHDVQEKQQELKPELEALIANSQVA